jgi:nicotinamidase-related amidase
MINFDWVVQSYKAGEKNRLDIKNSVLLLVDHQTGLNALARDFESSEFKNGVLFLAETAKEAGIPVILTTSAESGPNGPLWSEITDLFPKDKYTYVQRNGQINAWDDPSFREAVKKTGKTQLIIAGIVTEVLAVISSFEL